MDTCVNVMSLRIYSNNSEDNVHRARRCNKWIKQLNLDCLWLINVKQTNELIQEVTNLKELRIDTDPMHLNKSLQGSSDVERLSI